MHLRHYGTPLPYLAPSWAKSLRNIPTVKIPLASPFVPTQIVRWDLPMDHSPKALWIKRDDWTGIESSGNKIRKLEFLLAEAVTNKHDCVITVGGIQSNHCRTTAALARQIGLDSYLLLHSSSSIPPDQLLDGNLLLSRLLGARIEIFTPSQVQQMGTTDAICERLRKRLVREGRNPYVIPVGGSCALGTWGYIEAAEEILEQIKHLNLEIDDIVVATGTGSTVAGLGLGMKLAKSNIRVHGVCVCNSADFFYHHIDHIYSDLGAPFKAEEAVNIIEGYKGRGYGQTSPEEINLLTKISLKTGVILDPIYTLKAVRAILENDIFSGKSVLFVHTGGFFSIYSKKDQIAPELSHLPINMFLG